MTAGRPSRAANLQDRARGQSSSHCAETVHKCTWLALCHLHAASLADGPAGLGGQQDYSGRGLGSPKAFLLVSFSRGVVVVPCSEPRTRRGMTGVDLALFCGETEAWRSAPPHPSSPLLVVSTQVYPDAVATAMSPALRRWRQEDLKA